MPLLKNQLEEGLAKALKLRTKLIGKGEADPDEVEERVAKAMADAIDKYVKMADVQVFPGIPTAGGMTNQVTVGPGKGKLM